MLDYGITNLEKKSGIRKRRISKNQPKEKSALTRNGKKVSKQSWADSTPPFFAACQADTKSQIFADESVDLILTSPAYWRKRNYEVDGQLGREKSAEEYVESLIQIMKGWKRILKKTGSVFLNVGDSYKNGHLLEIPSMITIAARQAGWKLRHRIVWEKTNSTPHPARRRLAMREEYILHFSISNNYYSDLENYKERFSVSNVWRIAPAQHKGEHLAPFPEELVERVLRLSCPKYVCVKCNSPFIRQTEKTIELDESRPQARRALAILKEAMQNGKLTEEHIAAVQATGISDAGKAIKFQTGAGRNTKEVQTLAREAKAILKGYFRELTFAKKRTVGWNGCHCNIGIKPGLVYDPFLGSGTTLRVASKLGFSAVGSDLRIYDDLLRTISNLSERKATF